MGYGSNEAVRDAEDDFREKIAQAIAENAAELVAAGDMTRDKAIKAATDHQRYMQEAASDVTGTVKTLEEAQRPVPSRKVSTSQVKAIAEELIDTD
jgi:hypothetical protein